MKISDSKSVTSVDKKKKTGKASKADGTKFASLVESAMDKGEDTNQEQTATYTPGGSVPSQGFSVVPEKAEERGVYMLDTLDDLEKDILSGNPTEAIAKLQEALATKAINRDQLSPKMLALLDEIDLRASIEVAKLLDEEV